jgi:SAM-dependent methyltransferase
VERAPEFAEYFVHYPIKKTPYSSHSYARKFVGSGQEVLDVGCGRGFFAEELKANQNRVSGVDALTPDDVKSVFELYEQCDLNGGLASLYPKFGSVRFDLVLFLDILEHLRAPEALLRDARPLLKPNGRVLVSVPNVANLTVRLMLLFGRFNYTERGILDRTHLRFFTRKTAKRLAEDAGYVVVGEKLSVIPVELVLGLAPSNIVIRLLNSCLALVTKLLPGLFGYQILLTLRPARAKAL